MIYLTVVLFVGMEPVIRDFALVYCLFYGDVVMVWFNLGCIM